MASIVDRKDYLNKINNNCQSTSGGYLRTDKVIKVCDQLIAYCDKWRLDASLRSDFLLLFQILNVSIPFMRT